MPEGSAERLPSRPFDMPHLTVGGMAQFRVGDNTNAWREARIQLLLMADGRRGLVDIEVGHAHKADAAIAPLQKRR